MVHLKRLLPGVNDATKKALLDRVMVMYNARYQEGFEAGVANEKDILRAKLGL